MHDVAPHPRIWIAGLIAGIAGVTLASVAASSLDRFARFFLTAGDPLLVPGGLFIICLGVCRRIQITAASQEPAARSPIPEITS